MLPSQLAFKSAERIHNETARNPHQYDAGTHRLGSVDDLCQIVGGRSPGVAFEIIVTTKFDDYSLGFGILQFPQQLQSIGC